MGKTAFPTVVSADLGEALDDFGEASADFRSQAKKHPWTGREGRTTHNMCFILLPRANIPYPRGGCEAAIPQARTDYSLTCVLDCLVVMSVAESSGKCPKVRTSRERSARTPELVRKYPDIFQQPAELARNPWGTLLAAFGEHAPGELVNDSLTSGPFEGHPEGAAARKHCQGRKIEHAHVRSPARIRLAFSRGNVWEKRRAAQASGLFDQSRPFTLDASGDVHGACTWPQLLERHF